MDTQIATAQDKIKKKGMVVQNTNIKLINCFLQTNFPNITLANETSCTVKPINCAVVHN